MLTFIYSIIFIAFGIYSLVTPFEKFQEKFPKTPIKSAGFAKGLGAFVLVIGIFLLVLNFL